MGLLRQDTCRRAERAGFSLLELSIVVLVLGILAAMGTPLFASTLNRISAEQSLSAVTGAFEYARLATVTTGRPHKVTLNSSANSVLVEMQRAPNMATVMGATGSIAASTVEATKTYVTATHPSTRQGYQFTLSTPAYGNGDIISVLLAGDSSLIYTYPGVPDSGGTIVLRRGGIQYTLTVNSTTGLLSVS